MVEIDLTTDGFDEVLDNLEAITPALAADVIGRGLRAAADVVAKRARQIVPVDTGALKGSIKARYATVFVQLGRGRRRLPKAGAVVFAGNVRGAQITLNLGGSRVQQRSRTPGRALSGAAHALLVEYGTVRTPAQPYIGPAAMAPQTSSCSCWTSGARRV